jgi:hypothetical protein
MRRIAGQAIAILVILGAALAFALLAYVSWRDSNVSTVGISRLSDLEEVFEVDASGLRLRSPEFLTVCFTGDYVHALKDSQDWFRADNTKFRRAFRAAGGRADPFNGNQHSSIVLLSHSSALILQLEWRQGLLLANLGCASTAFGDIQIKRYQTNPTIKLYLPNATLKSPRVPGQPRATLCEEKMERLVESIDDLLGKHVLKDELFWAAMRKYLPPAGCTANEVVLILRRSRFLVEPLGDGAHQTMRLTNGQMGILFRLDKETGKIDEPQLITPDRSFS